MSNELSNFAARLCFDPARPMPDHEFNELALELFGLQFKYNPAYRKICDGRRCAPDKIKHWRQIPAVPAAAFKELELSSIPPHERTTVFHSSGTTEQRPSRHFHHAESLGIYETSLWQWFFPNVLPDLRFAIYDLRTRSNSAIGNRQSAIILTPPPEQAPHSSLIHMFETVRRKLGVPPSGGRANAELQTFLGTVEADGGWSLNNDTILPALSSNSEDPDARPILLLGTAFSFVHLLDHLAERNLRFPLPRGSRVMETGGYKNRSRWMPKTELHGLITERLGVPSEDIICEYGMSELSSQAYDRKVRSQKSEVRTFQFPPWARVQIISPETGREVTEGATGLIRVVDLANVFSVMAVQTEDLGVRHGDGFELLGRAQQAEARGCSLMTA